YVSQCEPVAAIVARGTRIARPHQMLRWTGFHRDSAGPGWVLVGDAGHFKDPAPGQGVTDAFRQSERLAPEIVAGLGGSGDLDERMTAWWKWRDEDSAEKAWFAADLGAGGRVPPVLVEVLSGLAKKDRLDLWFDIFNHRVKPSKALTPGRLMAATCRLLRKGEQPRREVFATTKYIVKTDMARKKMNRKPVYAGGTEHTGGATEVDDPQAV